MMVDRRSFVSGTALLALTPVLNLLPAVIPTPAAEATRLVMKIDGWSVPDQSRAGEEVWIRLDRSWRTAWR